MIHFLNLKAQYATIQNEVEAAALTVMRNGQYVLGKEVAAFEEKFAEYCHAKYAIAVNSGTSALHLALLAADIGPGDEVITVAMTFVASVAAIIYAGATPILIDVDATTWNMDPALIERAITPRTKAIMPVHLHGQMANMDAIEAIAKKHNLMIIEDACQAHGATHNGRRAGSIGMMNAFSFYPGKNLGAYGEGGAVVTSDADLAKKIRMLRDFGQETKYHHLLRGYNYRMEAIQGAVLGVKLKYLEQWTQQRGQIAQWYRDRLQNLSFIKLPNHSATSRHVYHVFAIRIRERDRILQALAQCNIMTNIHYPIPVHLQPAYSNLGYAKNSLPITEQLTQEFLSLPLYPELTEVEVAEVCQQLLAILDAEKNLYEAV